MPSFGVVADAVVAFVAEPIGKWPVLSLLLAEPPLHKEGFVGSH